MTEENQKDLPSSQKNIKQMHLAAPKHGVLVIFIKNCFHCIGWIHRQNYL